MRRLLVLSSGSRLVPADQPCRCLWRPLSHITMIRPCRRTIWHFAQILLTLGLTFTSAALLLAVLLPTRSRAVPVVSSSRSLVAVDDATT